MISTISIAESLSKIASKIKAMANGTTQINKKPKTIFLMMIPRHSFCFFAVATMASFMFKFYLFWDFMFRANFSEIYAVKVRVLGE